MKEGLLNEIELEPHEAPTVHPFPHPYGMPTTYTIPGTSQPKGEENFNANRILNISSKIGLIRIQFEADSKQSRKAVNPKLFKTFALSLA